MEIQNDIDNLKTALISCKERLDNSYQRNDYLSITEEADKIAKLSYAISFLERNHKIQ